MTHLEPLAANHFWNWLFQLDDEPNLYIGNGWRSPNIYFLMVVWGSRQGTVSSVS